jgi:HEPN domain-containing protein
LLFSLEDFEQALTPEEYAKEWLSFAEMDVSSAEFLLGKWPVPREIICYHCQQSAEKCLKGLLVLKDQMPPKTHDLSFLYDLCKPFFPEIVPFSVQCTELNPYSSQPRYSKEITITEQSMKAAIENAKAIYRFTEPFISPKETC